METINELIIFLHDNAAIVFMFGLLIRAMRFVLVSIRKKKASKSKAKQNSE
jgi:hypothetical protein